MDDKKKVSRWLHTSSWVNMCKVAWSLCAFIPPVSPANCPLLCEACFPDARHWLRVIPPRRVVREPPGQLCVPTVTPLGAGNTSWEFLAVWHSVTRCRNILSPRFPSLRKSLVNKKRDGHRASEGELCLCSPRPAAFVTGSSMELHFHKERKPGLSAAQCPRMSTAALGLSNCDKRYFSLSLCNTPYQESQLCNRLPRYDMFQSAAG